MTPWTVARQAPLSVGFSRQEYWSGLPFPSPGDLPNHGMEPRSPLLQADSLPAEPQGKPKNTGVGSLPLLQHIFLPRNWTGVSCIAGRIFTNCAIREADTITVLLIKYFVSGTVVKFMYNFILWNNKRDYSYHHLAHL